MNAKIFRSYEDFISPLELNKKHSKSNISVMEVYYQIIFYDFTKIWVQTALVASYVSYKYVLPTFSIM